MKAFVLLVVLICAVIVRSQDDHQPTLPEMTAIDSSDSLSKAVHDLTLSIIEMYELIQQRSGYVPDSNYNRIPYLKLLLDGDVLPSQILTNQPQLDLPIVTEPECDYAYFVPFFEKFNLHEYADTSRYKLTYNLFDVKSASCADPDDPDLILTTIGYGERIYIKEKKQGGKKYYIQFYYFSWSSIIRGVWVADNYID
jgi:hypothetical protein